MTKEEILLAALAALKRRLDVPEGHAIRCGDCHTPWTEPTEADKTFRMSCDLVAVPVFVAGKGPSQWHCFTTTCLHCGSTKFWAANALIPLLGREVRDLDSGLVKAVVVPAGVKR